MAFVLQQVRDTELPKVSGDPASRKEGVTLTVSHVEITQDGLLVWIDFTVPASGNSTCTGTCEVIVSYDGEVQTQQTIGCVTEY